jgi:hypothetical protein
MTDALVIDVSMSPETAGRLAAMVPLRFVTYLPDSETLVMQVKTWGFPDAEAVVADLRSKAGDDIHQVLDVESAETTP